MFVSMRSPSSPKIITWWGAGERGRDGGRQGEMEEIKSVRREMTPTEVAGRRVIIHQFVCAKF